MLSSQGSRPLSFLILSFLSIGTIARYNERERMLTVLL